jgi:Family of unknown function (DUF5723)
MKGKLIVVLLLAAFLFSLPAKAQNEGTMYFMNSLPQVVYLNPAFVPKYKTSIGLPGSSIMMSYSNNGFSYNDVAVKNNDVVSADLNKLYRSLRPKNYISVAAHADLFRLSIKMGPRFYFTYNSTLKIYNRLMLPKDLMGIFINGTASFIGSSATLAPKLESLAYLENGIGGAFTVNKDLVIGARVKWLKGIANATTKSSALNLEVDADNYALTASGDMDVRTSGVHSLDDPNFDFGDDYKNYLKNNGFAIDLGATYRLMDRINLSLSVVDLGFIKWKNDTYNYKLDPNKAKYSFDGIDLNKVLTGDDDYLNSVGDSISSNFEPTEGVTGSYKTSIPTKIYVGGNYEIRRNFTAGIVLYSEMFRGRFMTGATLGVHKNFGKTFSATGTYTMSNNSFNNIGLGASLNLPPFQLYVVGDNILRAAVGGKELNKFINSTQLFNLRVGLNLVFGWDKGPDKLAGNNPSPDYKSKRKIK